MDGSAMVPRRAPTVKEVAEAAGVSVATVSRVLNHQPRVDPGRRDRVLEAIARLGYRRDAVARNLRRRSTRVWGLIISDIQNPFFTALVRGVQDRAEREGYAVILLNTDEDTGREWRCLELMAEERAAGVLIAPVSESESAFRPLLDPGTPVVLIDRGLASGQEDLVRIDNERGAYEGARHLLEQGYRRVACISGPMRATTGRTRYEGYRRALEEAGGMDAGLVRHTDFKARGGYEAAIDLFGSPRRPDAVIVMNNLMTEGTLQALRDLGLAMPDDVGVVGFDNVSWAPLVDPPLTTVAQPIRELGLAAADLLARRCGGDLADQPLVVTLAPELVVRRSSVRAVPPPRGGAVDRA
jgi:LacI family transcriptional regulator